MIERHFSFPSITWMTDDDVTRTELSFGARAATHSQALVRMLDELKLGANGGVGLVVVDCLEDHTSKRFRVRRYGDYFELEEVG